MDDPPSMNGHTREIDSPPASGEVKLAEGDNLLKLSLELREMIYQHYFSQEGQQTAPGDQSTEEYRSTFQLKMPLLRANKLVRADALPSIYGYHIFRIRHTFPGFWDHNKLPSLMTSGIQPLRRIELLTRDYIDNTVLKPLVVPYLQDFLDLFPKLRLLILHFYYSAWPACHVNLEISRLLNQLLERLGRLEIVLCYHKDDCQKGLDVLQELAPRARWIEGPSEHGGRMDGRYRKAVWALERSMIPKAPEIQTSGIKDHPE